MIQYRMGDCLDILKGCQNDHFDSCVTDPPYGLAFMGKTWDMAEVGPFTKLWGEEVLRILKPGAHLLSFGGTRTYHRMVCALEDVGFQIRDCLMWLYGSGFPKSLNVSLSIDKHLNPQLSLERKEGLNSPFPPEAEKWNGWGTALKPAYEPIVLARKPLEGTVAKNVLKYGTGGINVDGCRIEFHGDDFQELADNRKSIRTIRAGAVAKGYGMKPEGLINSEQSPLGRWPSNVLLDEDAAKMLDEQSGESRSTIGNPRGTPNQGLFAHSEFNKVGTEHDDSGGASRFFYVAKASRSEREKGLKGKGEIETRTPMAGRGQAGLKCAKCGKWKVSGNPCQCDEPDFQPTSFERPNILNIHPTVKPLELMRYLVKLVTPKDGICLDPFLGSGTTLLACRLEGFNGLGIEKEPTYEPIIKERLAYIPPALDSFEEVAYQ